jgi:hypothetical protein
LFLQFWSGTFLQIQLEDRVSVGLPRNFEHSTPDRRAAAYFHHRVLWQRYQHSWLLAISRGDKSDGYQRRGKPVPLHDLLKIGLYSDPAIDLLQLQVS